MILMELPVFGTDIYAVPGFTTFISFSYDCKAGARGGIVVKVLRYKPAGRGFDSRMCHWNFSVT